MNAEDLVIAFKRDMAKLSGTERRRAIESVRGVIRTAAFDDAAGSAYEVERSRVCLKTAYTMRHRLIECLSAHCPHSGSGGAAAASSMRSTSPSRSRARATARRGCSRCRIGIVETVEWSHRDIRGGGAAMPSNIPATTIRVDPEVKREATVILDELGLSMSTAVNAFLRALVREGGMLFEMKVKAPAIDLKR